MSSYCAPADLVTYAVPAAALTNIGSPQQQAVLDAASGIVDSFLGSRFHLPLTGTIPAEIKEAVCSIAGFKLICARGFNPESKLDSGIKERHDTTMEWLKAIAEGEAAPRVADSSPTPASSSGPFVQQYRVDPITGQTITGTPSPRGW